MKCLYTMTVITCLIRNLIIESVCIADATFRAEVLHSNVTSLLAFHTLHTIINWKPQSLIFCSFEALFAGVALSATGNVINTVKINDK